MRAAFFVLLLCAPLAAHAQADLEKDIQRCREIGDSVQRLACYDSLNLRPHDPAQAAEDFGKPQAPPKEPVSIQSRLVGRFSSWEKGTMFTLENGQVWKSIGDDTGYYPGIPDNPDVIITKSFFGAYWMEVVKAGRKIKVKRVK